MESLLDFIPNYCPHCGNVLRPEDRTTTQEYINYQGMKQEEITVLCSKCDIKIYVELNNPFFNM